MWLGVPLGLVYAASRLADTLGPTLGPYLLVFIGLPIGMAVMAKLLGYLDRVHQAYTRTGDDRPRRPWMRSMRGERGSTPQARRARHGDDRVRGRSRWPGSGSGSSASPGRRCPGASGRSLQAPVAWRLRGSP